MSSRAEPMRIFLVAGEQSGDHLGGLLMAAMQRVADRPVAFAGVGGETMTAAGLRSLFPISDIAVMGPAEVVPRLPMILRRMSQTVAAVEAWAPHALVILDSPEFNQPVARRVRRRCPGVPIANYVSPQVWAWRAYRARRMRRYIDHVLAILPFEPGVHARLGGPPCTYVGHPLVERLGWIRAQEPQVLARRLDLDPEKPVLAVLPGSRANEVKRLMGPFGGALRLLLQRLGPLQAIVPAVDSVRPLIERALPQWPLTPHLVRGPEAKFQAFRLARAALAASGTATLELALAGTPSVVAYRVEPWLAPLRRLVNVPSIVLANLVLEDNLYPELVQEACTAENLAGALQPLMVGGPERAAQIAGLRGLERNMALSEGTPSERAARIVLDMAAQGRVAQPRSAIGT